MSSNNEGLSRDALIEKVEDALIARPGRAVVVAGGVAKMPVEAHAAIALDAVLRAVADDLEAWADDEDCGCQTTADWTVCDCSVSLTANGVRDAAERVRDLLGKDKTNE